MCGRWLVGVVVVIVLCGGAARGAGAVSKDPVDVAVATLQGEADKLFDEKTSTYVSMLRPHKAVEELGAEQLPKVLKVLGGRLGGDPARDMYVRWHMMWVVKASLPGLAKPLEQSQLMALVRALPEDIPYKGKSVWSFDPPDIGSRYQNLIESGVVKVGFAPFERWVYPPDSFQYMDAKKRAAAEANYNEAKKLEGKFKRVVNYPNDAYNWRMGYMNLALRMVRGELYYAALVQNPQALDELVDAIGRGASGPATWNRAMDLAAYLNLAYGNGVMAAYPKDVLKSAAGKLKVAAGAYQRVAPKPSGWKPSDKIFWGWNDDGGRNRHLSDELFTVVTGIENDYVPRAISPFAMSRPLPAAPPVATTEPVKLKPEDVRVADIDAAIGKAVAGLEKMAHPEIDFGHISYAALGYRYSPPDFVAPGQGALSTWAMLASGERFKSGWMQGRVNWVLCYDSPSTYDRAMRLMMMTMMPPSERKAMGPWVARDARWLAETITEQGGWEANNLGVKSAATGDNANSQYAMLGLSAASQTGFEVSEGMWERIDKYWRLGQRPAGAPGEGGWAVVPSFALQRGANLNAFTNQASASMTAGGVLSLFNTESFLNGEKFAEVGQSLSPELLRGVRWLDENFSLTKLDGDSDFYYYTWTIQNVGQATGYRTFNKVDWFRETTAMLLNTQGANGMWDGPKGPVVSTSFALLYLYRARGPLAICKLRIDPVGAKVGGKAGGGDAGVLWNNRPNDLYNLTRDISRQAEVPTNWQIADLDQPVYQLIESPILYLATNQAFRLSAAHVARLKEYLNAGGMLVCVPEGATPGPVVASMKALAGELCPGIEGNSRQTGDKHGFYTLFSPVKGSLPITTYENTVRPLVVVVEKDIGKDLQLYKATQRDAFDLLENIYVYANGKNTNRPRIASNFLVQHVTAPATKLAVARVKVAGDFDPEPLAMGQLKAMMADDFKVDLQVEVLTPGQLTKGTKVAFLTMTGATELSDVEVGALKKWVEDGGTLWVDAAGLAPGGVEAVKKVNALAPRLGLEDMPQGFEKHPIMTGEGLAGGFDNKDPELRHFANGPTQWTGVRGKITGTHANVVLADGDVMSGVAGMNHWGIAGYTVKSARQIVVNGLLMAVKENAPPATQPTTTTAPGTMPATAPATQAATVPATLPAGN